MLMMLMFPSGPGSQCSGRKAPAMQQFQGLALADHACNFSQKTDSPGVLKKNCYNSKFDISNIEHVAQVEREAIGLKLLTCLVVISKVRPNAPGTGSLAKSKSELS